ncbi:hypothetical protein [Sandaracinus amylolyticus]|uniref:hypothetical protein n=1 Tax=Sandaracinus amylolyticus TaxID=927083 RepID=UPI001F3229CD|nr:hypothetical protein [Sandaracinus amylolyticus]UJR79855.1 Hypothetical protein I5071_18940 [Sandaracinus amylolyticus]
MSTPNTAWTPTLKPSLAWRAARRIGGDDAARATLSAGTDAALAWSEIKAEHDIARTALEAGTVDLHGVVTRAIAAARAIDPKNAIGGELAAAFEKSDARALMMLAPRAHAGLRAGKATRALTWAADAALLLATGEVDDATFAALEALREASEAGAPGAVERWRDARAIPDAFNPYSLIELVTEDLPPEQETMGRRFVGYRPLVQGLDTATALKALRILVDDCGDPLTIGACSTYRPGLWSGKLDEVGAYVGGSNDGVRFAIVPQLGHAACWSRWIEASLDPQGLRWRVAAGAPGARTGAEREALHEAIELALEGVVEGTRWARAWSAASKALDRYHLIGLGNSRDAEGWRASINGDPDVLEQRFRAMRR